MKILIAYYSRTGLTKKIAESISKEFDAQIDEIIDSTDRSGPKGYMIAGKDAVQKRLTSIAFKQDPKEYDLIIVGGPVWAWTVTPAVRTYITLHKEPLQDKKVAFFATQASSGADGKFKAMQGVIEKTPVSTLIINGKDFREKTSEEKIRIFIDEIKKYSDEF
jgi:menaquinone-dependent protoporphyrinogen IX oxidase